MLDREKLFELIKSKADQTAWSSLWVNENTPETTRKGKDEICLFSKFKCHIAAAEH